MKRSYPFDSVVTGTNEYGLPIGDRDYNSNDMRRYISSFLSTGIKNGDTNLNVIKNNDLEVAVQTGIAIIEGAFFEVYDEAEVLEVQPNLKSRIVIRLDLNKDVRDIFLKVIEGDADNPPPLTRNSEIYEISLAQVITGSDSISEIIDERADNNLCGYINSLIKVDVTTLLNKIENELKGIEDESLFALKNGTLQEGLNAEMLGGIKLANIYLNSKYHLPIFSQTVEPISFNSSLIPTMSSNSQNGFTVSASVNTDTAYRLYDNSDDTNINRSSDASYESNIQFPYYVKINTLRIRQEKGGSYGSVSYTLKVYGSNDGSNYELADTKSIKNSSTTIYDLDISLNIKYYKYIKLHFDCEYPLYIYNISIINGFTLSELDINRFDLNYNLDVYENWQKISIRTPSNFVNYGLNTKMRIGNLEYLQMPNDMKADENIELIYNGTSFVRR